MTPFDTIEHKGCTISLYQDEDCDSPREWDNIGEILYMKSSRYLLGDRGTTSEEMNEIQAREDVIWLPVYAYIHSGTRLNTTGFSCPWDSGQCGIIWCTKARAIKEWGKKRFTPKVQKHAENCLRGEIDTFDAYLRGAVAGFVATDADGDDIDSCWGFYPDEKGSYSEVIDEAKSAIDSYIETRDQQAEQHQALIGG